MFFWSLCNFLFDDAKNPYLFEEFAVLLMKNAISCKFVYLSAEMLRKYQDFSSSPAKTGDFRNNLEDFNEISAQFQGNREFFRENSRNYSEELHFLLETAGFFVFCLKSSKFIAFLLQSRAISLENLIAFDFLRKFGFFLESGRNFGFDYLLYEKKNEKSQRSHSIYAVSLLNCKEKVAGFDILGKIRVARNYKKVKYCNFIGIFWDFWGFY